MLPDGGRSNRALPRMIEFDEEDADSPGLRGKILDR
jgi:hypothetical protein